MNKYYCRECGAKIKLWDEIRRRLCNDCLIRGAEFIDKRKD